MIFKFVVSDLSFCHHCLLCRHLRLCPGVSNTRDHSDCASESHHCPVETIGELSGSAGRRGQEGERRGGAREKRGTGGREGTAEMVGNGGKGRKGRGNVFGELGRPPVRLELDRHHAHALPPASARSPSLLPCALPRTA
eukprot:1482189-Rhodomonas_salina.1